MWVECVISSNSVCACVCTCKHLLCSHIVSCPHRQCSRFMIQTILVVSVLMSLRPSHQTSPSYKPSLTWTWTSECTLCPGGRNDFGPSNVLLMFVIVMLLMFSPPLPPRDGVISKDEMTQYFLGAYQSLRRIFKHNFQECSYLSPTYCDHCKGRLIGYVRQGYKCKGEPQGVCVHWCKGSTSALFNSCVEVLCVLCTYVHTKLCVAIHISSVCIG